MTRFKARTLSTLAVALARGFKGVTSVTNDMVLK